MFEGWQEFYLVVGGAAAVLLGLIFVVVTLMHDKSRDTVVKGSRLYMGPIVLHMAFVLALSTAALTPRINHLDYALLAAVIALWGAARGIYSTVGINRLCRIDGEGVHWTDPWFYGVAPMVLYVALGGVAWGFWQAAGWAPYGVGAVQVGLLLVSIRDEYDLVTWLAPRHDDGTSPDSRS